MSEMNIFSEAEVIISLFWESTNDSLLNTFQVSLKRASRQTHTTEQTP